MQTLHPENPWTVSALFIKIRKSSLLTKGREAHHNMQGEEKNGKERGGEAKSRREGEREQVRGRMKRRKQRKRWRGEDGRDGGREF